MSSRTMYEAIWRRLTWDDVAQKHWVPKDGRVIPFAEKVDRIDFLSLRMFGMPAVDEHERRCFAQAKAGGWWDGVADGSGDMMEALRKDTQVRRWVTVGIGVDLQRYLSRNPKMMYVVRPDNE